MSYLLLIFVYILNTILFQKATFNFLCLSHFRKTTLISLSIVENFFKLFFEKRRLKCYVFNLRQLIS